MVAWGGGDEGGVPASSCREMVVTAPENGRRWIVAAKFVRDFKSLANEANESHAKHKALEFEIECLLRVVVSQDIMSIVQNPTVVETSDLQTELERVDNTTKTKRPQPRSNIKNDRVPSASKSSCLKMTKVIKGEFNKIKDVNVEDVLLTCDTPIEVFNNEVNRLSEMDDNLFTYEVKVANIPCCLKINDDSEHEADDDMGYDPSDVAFIEWLGSKGDDEVELTDEESSDEKDEVTKVFRIDTNLFDFETPMIHFKTLSLDELRSPDFNLRYDQEFSEEEVAEIMAETMEQYMSKTRAEYGSGVARPKIDDKDNFELKGLFLKELRTNTFSGSDHEDANEHIEKVLEIVDLFHIPNITIDQVMLRAFPMSLTGAQVVG
ncbi:hypothetical protein Tco_0096776 [Tanacetum coccineum]